MEALNEVLPAAETKMRQAAEALQKELAGIRTGRASPGLVEHLRVEYHGVPTPLSQLASIATPEPRLIVIQPWEGSVTSAIERAILKSNIGLNPSSDGRVIRLAVPPLTEQRRHELVRLVRQRVEEGKVAVRNVRREALEELRRQERDKEISQDESKRAAVLLQEVTESVIAEVEAMGQDKEAEVMEI